MKTKIKSILLLLCATFSLGTASFAKTANVQTTHYEVKLKSANFGNMGTRKMWIKGSNMRWEVKSERLPLCVVKNRQGTFLIHPWKNIAAKYPENSLRDVPVTYLPGPSGSPASFLKSVKARLVGQKTKNKQQCKVYTYVEPLTKRSCKLWVGVKSGKPVELLVKGIQKKQDTFTATYTKFEQGERVSDKLFELPKGYAIKPMPTRKLTSIPNKSNSVKRG